MRVRIFPWNLDPTYPRTSQIFNFVDFGPIFSEVGGFDEEQKSEKSRFETTIYSLNISKSSRRKTVSSQLGCLMDGFESNFKFQRPRTRPRWDIVSDVEQISAQESMLIHSFHWNPSGSTWNGKYHGMVPKRSIIVWKAQESPMQSP